MAAGDIVLFNQFRLDAGKKLHDLSADALKVSYVKSAANGGIDPAASTSDPRWGAGGGTNLSSSEVATGSSYSAGGIALTTITWTLVSGVPTLRADIVTTALDATGFTNARWGIIYNNTDAGKRAMAYVDLGADRSIQTGSLTLDWTGVTNDIATF